MIVGYARTSTLDQTAGLEAQQRDLTKAGCEKVFVEQVSSVDVKAREKLAEALEFIRDSDTIVVTKLDRMARSVAHLLEILEAIEAKGASLRILDMAIDTSTPNGRLMLNILGSVAQFEREIMLERQREGIAKAKAEGKYKGRSPTARAKTDQVLTLKAEGIGPAEIARRLRIGRASVYRILKEQKAGGQEAPETDPLAMVATPTASG
ncbi:MAG: recombinase family protein [Yoonia sp.]